MTIPKFTEKDLEKLQAEAEIKIYKGFQINNPQLGLPTLNQQEERNFWLGYQRCSPKIWDFFEKAGPTVKQRLFTQAVYNAILSESEIDRYELACNNLEPFMIGSRTEAGPKEKTAYRNFQYYKELSVEAMKYFYNHFARTDFFGFSASAYDNWFSSLRLGLNSNPDRVLNGYGSLNYPDLKPQERLDSDYQNDTSNRAKFSPRLETLKTYLQTIYELQVKVQLLDILIRNHHTGNSPNVSMGQWEKFINSTRDRLKNKFGSTKGEQLFKKMFGSNNPTAPTSQQDFNAVQNEILDQIAQAILKEQMGEEWNPEPKPQSGFHRDYAGEQREREERARENQRQRERENPQWENINSAFKNNPNLVKEWTDKGFTYEQTKEWIDIGLKTSESGYAQWLKNIVETTPEQVLNEGDGEELRKKYQEWQQKPEPEKKEALKNAKNNNKDDDKPKPTEESKDKKRDKSPSRKAAEDKLDGKETPPPKHTEFNSSSLNDIVNGLSGALEDDTKKAGNDQPFTPSPGLGMPLTPNTMTKEEAEKLPWICMGIDIKNEKGTLTGGFGRTRPCWIVKDPATMAIFQHGSGEWITLQLKIDGFRLDEGYSNFYHNFFWAKNLDKKGYERLVKDDTLPSEKERRKLLISGEGDNDPRTSKYNWEWDYWKYSATVQIGVPNVWQKASAWTRWAKTYDKAFDLDNKSNFIGILKSKGLFGGFRIGGNGRVANWGSGPKKSVLWITNQMKYPYSKNHDWNDDDIKTINPDNGFSHYLIFSNLTTKEINRFFPLSGRGCKTLAELVGKIVKEGKGTMVRLGPDALELINELTPEQKDPIKNETPETKKATEENVVPQDLKDLGITPEELELLRTAYTDPAHLANIVKKLAQGKPEKMAEMMDKMFDTIHEKSAEAMFNQMVDHNPIFTPEEKENLKKAYQEAKTKEQKKKLWQDITSNKKAEEARQKREQEQKENQKKPKGEQKPDPRDKIMEEWINKNPRYGPPDEDTEDRRKRHEEWLKASSEEKTKMFEEEVKRFTQGENANQWSNYWQSGAKHESGAGDETAGTETDNNFSGQFSFADSIAAINKLKNLGSMKPEGMDEGMKSNQPYWKVVFSHPLTYIFLFIGIIIAIMAAATKKNRS